MIFCSPCFDPIRRYLSAMDISEIQNLAIQARMALIVGAKTFDRLFAGIRFDEADGGLLYAYAKDEQSAAEIEDDTSLHISVVASADLEAGYRRRGGDAEGTSVVIFTIVRSRHT